jgi:hypothetical protein
MGDNEALQKKLRELQESRTGRAKLRERVGVEHRLAHLTEVPPESSVLEGSAPREKYREGRLSLR